MDWKFTQSFGETKEDSEDVSEGDMITAVEFDQTGEYLSVGDKSGRIWIFEGHRSKNVSGKKKKFEPLEYKFHSQFQSHEPEFDCLKSLEIEEKINKIEWCNRHNRSNNMMLLTANGIIDKTIKCWKIHEKRVLKLCDMNIQRDENGNVSHSISEFSSLKVPKPTLLDKVNCATSRRVYSNAHAYHINSISLNSDGETFISADDLRINLWHLDIGDRGFNIVDIKPANMDDLTEVITSSVFHPHHCNILMYASSQGAVRLLDLRENALCDQHSKIFEVDVDSSQQTFFSEIIASVSDAHFSNDGRYIYVRDYLTVKIWDVNMESRPVQTIPIHDFLQPKLSDLYENDRIFDKFYCAVSGDGQKFVSGSYNDNFLIYDWNSNASMMIEAGKPAPRPKKPAKTKARDKPEILTPSINADNINFNKKTLFVAWHPTCNTVAVAGLNNLYLYQS